MLWRRLRALRARSKVRKSLQKEPCTNSLHCAETLGGASGRQESGGFKLAGLPDLPSFGLPSLPSAPAGQLGQLRSRLSLCCEPSEGVAAPELSGDAGVGFASGASEGCKKSWIEHGCRNIWIIQAPRQRQGTFLSGHQHVAQTRCETCKNSSLVLHQKPRVTEIHTPRTCGAGRGRFPNSRAYAFSFPRFKAQLRSSGGTGSAGPGSSGSDSFFEFGASETRGLLSPLPFVSFQAQRAACVSGGEQPDFREAAGRCREVLLGRVGLCVSSYVRPLPFAFGC